MCKECKKLIELYAETQLECVKNNKYISKVIINKCSKCGENVVIAGEITNNFLLSTEPPLNTGVENDTEMHQE